MTRDRTDGPAARKKSKIVWRAFEAKLIQLVGKFLKYDFSREFALISGIRFMKQSCAIFT